LQNEYYASPHLLTRNVFDCGILKNFHSLTTFIINFKEVIRGQNNHLLITCMITKKTSSIWQVWSLNRTKRHDSRHQCYFLVFLELKTISLNQPTSPPMILYFEFHCIHITYTSEKIKVRALSSKCWMTYVIVVIPVFLSTWWTWENLLFCCEISLKRKSIPCSQILCILGVRKTSLKKHNEKLLWLQNMWQKQPNGKKSFNEGAW
jgi:hypothetical protein